VLGKLVEQQVVSFESLDVVLPIRGIRDECASRFQDPREFSQHPANGLVVDVLEQIERTGEVHAGLGDAGQIRDVRAHESHVRGPPFPPPPLGELDRPRRCVDADRFSHVRREQEADVAERAPEIENRLVGGRPRERKDVALALAPLSLRRRERRDAVELVEILVGVEIVSKQGSGLHLPHRGPGCHVTITC
jgi:hypothetical protein